MVGAGGKEKGSNNDLKGNQFTPKRSRLDNAGNRDGAPSSAPAGFMRDARRSYEATDAGKLLLDSKKDDNSKADGKRKAPEPDESSSDSDSDDNMSSGARIQHLGYRPVGGQQIVPHSGGPSGPSDAGSSRQEPLAIDYFDMYKQQLARPTLMEDGYVENPDEPLKSDLSYEEFLRGLLKSGSDKTHMFREALQKIPGAVVEPEVESPDQSSDSGRVSLEDSSSEAEVSEEDGTAHQVFNSTVQITVSPSPDRMTVDEGMATSSVNPLIPITPAQPAPTRTSATLQGNSQGILQVYQGAASSLANSAGEGMVTNFNSFAALSDDYI